MSNDDIENAARVLAREMVSTQDMRFCKLIYDEALRAAPFDGLSGQVAFDDNDAKQKPGHNDAGDRSAMTMSLLNVNTDGTIQEVAKLLVEMEDEDAEGEDAGVDITFVPDNSSTVTWADGSQSFTRIPSDRSSHHLGAQAWYAVIVLLFVSGALLLSGVATTQGRATSLARACSSLCQESLIVVSVGVLAGIFVRIGGDHNLTSTAVFDETTFTFVLLPIIIFDSGFGMRNKKLFFHNLGSIIILAVLGTVLAALLIGGLLYASDASAIMTVPEYMATGALLSAIDPVATLGVFSKLGVPQRLSVLVVGESVINDAVAIVLFQFGFHGEASDSGSLQCFWLGNLLEYLRVMLPVCALTLKCTHRGRKTTGSEHSSRIQCMLLLLFAYLAFAVCEGLTLSGIVASMSAGLTASLYCANNMSDEGKVLAKSLFEILAAVSESIVFFSVGLNISLFIGGRGQAAAAALPLLAITYCLLSRALVVPSLVCCLNCRRGADSRISAREQLVMWHAGLRGAIAWALLLNLVSEQRYCRANY